MISLIPIFWRLNSCGEQAIFNLDIKKKFGLSINPDIHHSKVVSSLYFYCRFLCESDLRISCLGEIQRNKHFSISSTFLIRLINLEITLTVPLSLSKNLPQHRMLLVFKSYIGLVGKLKYLG